MCQATSHVMHRRLTELVGTGMERARGQQDRTATARHGLVYGERSGRTPGEEMRLELMVWDTGDHWFDTRRAARRLRVERTGTAPAGSTH